MNSILFIGQIIGIIPISAVLLFLLAKLVARHRLSRVHDGRGYAVLITGCDSGFGHQLARCLDHKGFVVFAGCLSPEGTGALSLARQSSRNLKILKLDVTSEEDVQQAKRTVQENLPEKGLWAVVNNAGITDWAEIEWSTFEDFRNMIDVNLFGSIRTSIAFLPLVRAAEGRMVYVSSIFAFFNCLNMGGLQRVEEGPGGVRGLLESGNGQFWCEGQHHPAGQLWPSHQHLEDEVGPGYLGETGRGAQADLQPAVPRAGQRVLHVDVQGGVQGHHDGDRRHAARGHVPSAQIQIPAGVRAGPLLLPALPVHAHYPHRRCVFPQPHVREKKRIAIC
uniref:Uncharacterized protein n=1 Tax=Scophthalmus maximus TaxID=52904 RepID=A0A8D3CUW6_SCOMX